MHRQDTRARGASLVTAALLAMTLVGCSSAPTVPDDARPPMRTLESVAPGAETTEAVIDQFDPFEGFNRGVYRFNAWFDDTIFLPIVGAYDFLLPDLVKTGVNNFMRNVGEIETFLNAVLQLKGEAATETAGRFVVNTTVGVLGVWDPATRLGITRHNEDFGQTLGHYGAGPGPFLILPILGPSSVRDGIGLAVDAYAFSEIDPLFFDSNEDAWKYSYRVLNAIDARRSIGFRYFETGSPFEYELMRLLYLKARELEIAR